MEQTMLLHNQKKLDDHFRRWPDHDLSLSPLLGIVHALEGIIQHTDSHHSPESKLLKKVKPIIKSYLKAKIFSYKYQHYINANDPN